METVNKLIGQIKGKSLNDKDKARIKKTIDRTFSEYGEVLKLLGAE